MDEEVGTEFRAAETTAVPAHERLRAMSMDSEPELRMETAVEPQLHAMTAERRLQDTTPVTMAEPQLHAATAERRLQDTSPVTMVEPQLHAATAERRLQDTSPVTMAEPQLHAATAEPRLKDTSPVAMAEPQLHAATAEPRLKDASPVTMAEPQLHAMTAEPRLQDASPVTTAARVADLQDGEPLTATRTAADALARPRIGTVAAGTGLQPTTAALRATSGQPVEKRAAASQSGGGPASAGSGFKVSPEQYRAAIAPVLAASDQIAELSTSLSSFLSGMQAGKPWGDDESGKKFAEGEKGYLKYSEDTLKGLAGLPKGLKYIADGLKAMAENYEGAETALSGDMTGQDSELQATQGTYWSPAAGASSAAPTTPILPNATLSGIAQSRPHTTGRH